jgi:hypothetical protein
MEGVQHIQVAFPRDAECQVSAMDAQRIDKDLPT